MEVRQKKVLTVAAGIIVLGVIVGVLWTVRLPSPDGSPVPPPSSPVVRPAAFGDTFTLFFFGRSPDGSSIRSGTPLVPAKKLRAGESVGIRVETAPSLSAPVRTELRFLTANTREEPDNARAFRFSFTVRPGRFSYCCLRIPKTPGLYDVGVLINDTFVGFLPTPVEPPPSAGSDSLFLP